jgi:hypothetical protein
VTNQLIMEDLALIPEDRRLTIRYSDLIDDPSRCISGICEFAGLQFDEQLLRRTSAQLPPSRHTLTAPRPDKWRENAADVMPLLPRLEEVWEALRAFR